MIKERVDEKRSNHVRRDRWFSYT